MDEIDKLILRLQAEFTRGYDGTSTRALELRTAISEAVLRAVELLDPDKAGTTVQVDVGRAMDVVGKLMELQATDYGVQVDRQEAMRAALDREGLLGDTPEERTNDNGA